MKEHSVNVLVFSSSACVYGDNAACKETDKIQPVSPYGQTKAMVEQIMQDYAFSNSDFLGISLRYFNPIGAHPSGLIGESPLNTPSNLMSYIQKVASGALPFLNIYGSDYDTPDGTGVRDYIHVMDLATGHTAALEHAKKLKGFNAYNLGTGKGTSVLEIVAAFERASGIKLLTKVAERRPGDIAQSYAIPDKAN